DFQDKITDSAPKPGQADPAGAPRSETTQRVEYTLTVEDVAAFMRYHAKQPPRVGGRAWLLEWPFLLLMGIALAVLLLRQLQRPGRSMLFSPSPPPRRSSGPAAPSPTRGSSRSSWTRPGVTTPRCAASSVRRARHEPFPGRGYGLRPAVAPTRTPRRAAPPGRP